MRLDLAEGDALAGAGRVALGVLGEANVGAVVEGGAAGARGDDLEGGAGAVGDALGDGELVDAKGAAAGRVPEVGRQRQVKVCRVAAEAQVDKDVGPRVVQVQLEGAAVEGPLGRVARAVRDAGAWGFEKEGVSIKLL